MEENKVVAMNIVNFMSIENARIEFDEQNILSLCGYNDSGKSAITRLWEIMFYNAYSADQAKFVKDGAEFWEGSLEFSDGVHIERCKYLDGKSVHRMLQNGKVLYTNELPNGSVAAVSDIPEVISKYLGVIQDEFTEEKLNVRRNTDRLFLINTTGGDNYKILNSVLKSEVLAEASRQLNEDKNKLNTELINFKTTRDVIQQQLAEVEVAPKEDIEQVKGLVTSLEENKGRLTRLTMLSELRSQLNSMVVHEEVKSVDTTALNLLQLAAQAFNVCNKPIVEEVSAVEVAKLKELQAIAQLRSVMFVPMYNAVESVDISRYNEIMEVGKLYNGLYNANVAVFNVEQELDTTKKELAALSQQYNLKVCKNCGTVVE